MLWFLCEFFARWAFAMFCAYLGYCVGFREGRTKPRPSTALYSAWLDQAIEQERRDIETLWKRAGGRPKPEGR